MVVMPGQKIDDSAQASMELWAECNADTKVSRI